jgi:hypothetical protein
MSATITRSVTADELLAMPDDGYRYELVKGELRKMAPAGDEHGELTMALAAARFSDQCGWIFSSGVKVCG